MQARREEQIKKMEELQTYVASKHPIPPCLLTMPPSPLPIYALWSPFSAPGRWADTKVPLSPTFTKSMLDAKIKSVGLDGKVDSFGQQNVSAHVLLSSCSGGKGLSGIVPTKRTPQPHST